MQFEEIEYEFVEKILLGNRHFNGLQREFINLFETKTVVAGPGTGKTTMLAAKIVLLLRKLNEIGSKDGVCIITHTNVAVNEINGALQRAGAGSIMHPHFVGTIHEFFNRFCVIPYFKNEYKNSSLVFSEGHMNNREFYESYFERHHSWMNSGVRRALAVKTCESDLIVNTLQRELNLQNTSNWDSEKFFRNKARMLEAKVAQKKQGFLTYDDTFLFSKLFLLEPRFKKMLRDRFKYVFLDEYQDTTPLGEELLQEIFGTANSIYQKIGDPYQTITYGQPMPEINEQQVFRLDITNRFGNEIAEHLNIIMPEARIRTSTDKKSLAPIILLYKTEEDIYPLYKAIIEEYKEHDPTFKESFKEDKVLVWAREWTSILKPGSIYRDKKPKKLETKNTQIKRLVIDFIVKKIANDSDKLFVLKEWVSKHQKITELNITILMMLKKGTLYEEKQELKEFINEILDEKGINRINLSNQIFSQIENILATSFDGERNEKAVDDVFTIHSVNGETLRSVLVADFKDKPLTNILLHKYGVNEEADYLYTDHNLLYVAMSRVTHLFVFAMHKDDWTEEVRDKLKHSWTIKEI